MEFFTKAGGRPGSGPDLVDVFKSGPLMAFLPNPVATL
jgi:hypothetical protein